MTQDFAKPSTTRKPGKTKPGQSPRRKTGGKAGSPRKTARPPRRGKFIFTLVLLLGVFSYALYYLQTIPPTITPEIKHPEESKKQLTSSKSTKAKSQSEPGNPDQRFKFYDIFPESKVVSPVVDVYKYKEKSQNDGYYYLVQTGSFRKIQDAERQKATIAFQGLKANIKTVGKDSNNTWHRVMTGPFYDRSQMNSALDKLVAINIEPLVKRVKKRQ